jgi:hypothetical protein
MAHTTTANRCRHREQHTTSAPPSRARTAHGRIDRSSGALSLCSCLELQPLAHNAQQNRLLALNYLMAVRLCGNRKHNTPRGMRPCHHATMPPCSIPCGAALRLPDYLSHLMSAPARCSVQRSIPPAA